MVDQVMHAFLGGAAGTVALLLPRCNPAASDHDGQTLLHLVCEYYPIVPTIGPDQWPLLLPCDPCSCSGLQACLRHSGR
jgi:hypothetical protein